MTIPYCRRRSNAPKSQPSPTAPPRAGCSWQAGHAIAQQGLQRRSGERWMVEGRCARGAPGAGITFWTRPAGEPVGQDRRRRCEGGGAVLRIFEQRARLSGQTSPESASANSGSVVDPAYWTKGLERKRKARTVHSLQG